MRSATTFDPHDLFNNGLALFSDLTIFSNAIRAILAEPPDLAFDFVAMDLIDLVTTLATLGHGCSYDGPKDTARSHLGGRGGFSRGGYGQYPRRISKVSPRWISVVERVTRHVAVLGRTSTTRNSAMIS